MVVFRAWTRWEKEGGNTERRGMSCNGRLQIEAYLKNRVGC